VADFFNFTGNQMLIAVHFSSRIVAAS